jgi:hypothetical protein
VIQGFPYRSRDASNPPPAVSMDSARGLLRVALNGFTLVVQTSDIAPPPGAVSAKIDDTPIGLSFEALLAKFHADPNLAGKNIVKGTGGTIVLVTAMDEDPPPSRYDHGYQSYFYREYVLRDGVVVAYAYKRFEN